MHDLIRTARPGSFEPSRHYYPKALNAQLHPLVRFFIGLGNERIATRYCHLHPEADGAAVRAILDRQPGFMRWAGADLFCTTTETGRRRFVVIETNSSPSGQKSLPPDDDAEFGGYRRLLERSFLPALRRRGLPDGELAVLYDKNEMEASGYAATLAELCDRPVHLVPFHDGDPEPRARVTDGVVEILLENRWTPVRAALRYVTQRPWTRLPPITRTMLFNPVLVCLAGGRNKMLAAKAYDLYNADLFRAGLQIAVPETIWDVSREEVPIWVRRMGNLAMVKVPYANAGQGIFPITSPADLDAFMEIRHPYDRFVVQALVGNVGWSSRTREGRLYHVGTVPNRRGDIYVADLRMMVGAGPDGYFPVAIYARRARAPLADQLDGSSTPWEMVGTNLSVKTADHTWTTETERLMLMDQRDFNRLGVGLDDLIEAYVQTVLATTAIDRMARQLTTQRGRFRRKLFANLNPDPALLQEICT